MVIHPYGKYVFVAVCLVIAAALFVVFFEQIPVEGTSLALDWRGIWTAIAGGEIRYYNELGFRIPPWDALLVLPLGLLSMRASWGLMGFITVLVLVVSVPRAKPRWRFWLALLLLVTSVPALRHNADGNFEALVIGGLLLIVYGYERRHPYALAGGVLLAVAKPQETSLVMGVLALYVLLTFPRPIILKTAGLLAIVVVPMMLWRGSDWLTTMLAISQRGSIMDVSLGAALTRTGALSPVAINLGWLLVLVATLVVAWKSDRAFTRDKAAMLVAASLLLAPYSAGNSALTVLAVGVIPLFLQRPLLGGVLIAFFDMMYALPIETQVSYGAYYWTAILLLCWALFSWRVLNSAPTPEVDSKISISSN